MVASVFGPFHRLWPSGTPTKCTGLILAQSGRETNGKWHRHQHDFDPMMMVAILVAISVYMTLNQ